MPSSTAGRLPPDFAGRDSESQFHKKGLLSMTKMPITTAGAPSPSGAYSQGIAVGPWVFTAGVGPNDPVSGEVVGSTIEAQTQQVLSNLEAIVAARGLDRDNIVKVTAHLEDL